MGEHSRPLLQLGEQAGPQKPHTGYEPLGRTVSYLLQHLFKQVFSYSPLVTCHERLTRIGSPAAYIWRSSSHCSSIAATHSYLRHVC
jgi:hypothetical protein